MIKIGIVDDNRNSREQLKENLYRYQSEKNIELSITEYDAARSCLQDGKTFDLLYLDIDMPEMSGLELAEKIREKDNEVLIIFCTSYQQFALSGYEVSAIGYIVKPIEWYSFHLYTDRAVGVINGKRKGKSSEEITVKQGVKTRILDTNDIIYVEVYQHQLQYHVMGKNKRDVEIIKTRGTMQEATNRLSDHGFARCSASFLVNLKKITSVSNGEVLIDETSLRIGRTYKDSFVREFSKYITHKRWGTQ